MVHRLMLVGILSVALGLAACATSTEPFEYESYNEIKPGPGAFTGEEGAWTILRQETPADPEPAPAEDKESAGPEADSAGEDQKLPADFALE